MESIHRDFVYDPGFSTVATPLAVVFEHRRGVCQDFAHLALACLRSQGLAARYVSGYLETLPPPGGEKLIGADASHAWFSVFEPTRMARLRPNQQSDARRAPHHARLGARLFRCHAAQRRDLRRQQPSHHRVRGGERFTQPITRLDPVLQFLTRGLS